MSDANLLDQPRAQRDEDALNEAAVKDYLNRELGLEGKLSIQQFPGGASNLTYAVTVGDTDLILRRPPAGTKAKSAHDMGREVHILSSLHAVYPYCPKPLAYCEAADVLGEPFYVMERIKGIILRRDLPKGLTLSSNDAEQLSKRMVELQAELHNLDYAKAGLADFGKPEGYVARQISGWSDRFRKAKTDDVPDCEAIMAWLDAKQPADSAQSGIIHNDYKFDNVVLNADNPLEIIGVLDWEMATLGDPLMDVGCALCYWVQADDPGPMQLARMGPTNLPGMLSREGYREHYCAVSGRSMDEVDFYYVYGLFRLAVIAQQIYYRYYHGQTSNPKFKMFGQFVGLLAMRCQQITQA